MKKIYCLFSLFILFIVASCDMISLTTSVSTTSQNSTTTTTSQNSTTTTTTTITTTTSTTTQSTTTTSTTTQSTTTTTQKVEVNYPSSVNFLMINDTHGMFVDEDGYPGMAKVSTLFKKLDANSENIKIANGDIFQGTLVSSTLYGLPLVDALNEMEFDVFVLGNHEFDWGLDEIAKYKDGNQDNGELDMPVLGANVIDKTTNQIVDWMEPYSIIDYQGVKVGIIGVMGETHESSILSLYVKNYDFTDTLPVVKKYAKELRQEQDCDIVVVADHNYDESENKEFANLSGNERIDAIFCAHTHQKINDSLLRSDNKKIPVVQNYDKNDTAVSVKLNINENLEYIGYNTKFYYPKDYSSDSSLDYIVNDYQDVIDEGSRVLGYTSNYLSKSTLGKYACASMKEEFDVDVSIMNTGGVRNTIQSGNIQVSSVFGVFPFNNEVMIVEMTGSELKTFYNQNGDYMYFNNDFNSSNLTSSKIYKVAIIDYVFFGSRYTVFHSKEYIDTNIVLRDILVDYLDNLY